MEEQSASTAERETNVGDESSTEGDRTIVCLKEPGAVARLDEEQIYKMKVARLREELETLGLSTTGKKQELRERLLSAIQDDEQAESEDEEDVTDSDEESSEEEEEDGGRRYRKRDRKRRDDPTEEHGRWRTGNNRNRTRSTFTIKDVEGSLCHFNGDDKMLVKKWVSDFEDTSELLGWNDLQNFIYGKKMLQGSAKKFVSFERGITSWGKLKRCLIREFHVRKNNAEVHAQLYRRRKLHGESSRQYVYEMQEIAAQGEVDKEALIQYIIDGIPDSNESNKAVLYSSRNLRELKKNLEVYDRLRERTDRKRGVTKKEETKKQEGKETKTPASRRNAKSRCYACGSTEHIVQHCTNKDKGPRCFGCNEFGHISTACPKKSEEEVRKSVNCVRSADDKLVAVKINNVVCYALIDTGSDVNLIREDIFKKIARAKLYATRRVLTGFGNLQTIPMGRFDAELSVNGGEYNTEILVVPSGAMTSEVILGQNFLDQVQVYIRGGKITIKPVDTVVSEFKEKRECDGVNDAVSDDVRNAIRELMQINYVQENESNVRATDREKIDTLIANYRPAKNVNTSVETKIVLRSEEPISHRPRRLAPREKAVLDKQIAEWLGNGVIYPSTSEFASPVVIVPKKSGEYRVCIDYRKINRQMIRDRFPMPLIEESIDSLAEARVFSVIDLKSGFLHVPVEKSSRKYTAFVTPNGQYEFARTPFGLSNSPASFTRFITEIYKELIRSKSVIIYVDDVIIPGKTDEEAYEKLVKTLEIAAKNGLEINWSKSKFMQTRVEYLGHEIEGGRVYPSPTKTKAVQRFPTPRNKKQIQSFLGLTGYFRKFIRDYAKLARPLSELLKNEAKFLFETEQQKSFNALKNSLSSGPVLRIYNPKAETELHTDASKEGYGAVLLQKDVGEKMLHPVYFMSRKTSDAEKNYHSYELELLAVIRAVKKFRVYLLGVRFKLVTDCDALKKTLYKQDIAPKIARWALTLEEFEYDVEHRSGSQLRHVDALSRYPVRVVEDKFIGTLRARQEEDDRIRAIKQVLGNGPYEDYFVEGGLVMKQIGNKKIIVLPASMYVEVIRREHENGHFGVKKMAERISEEFYIPNLTERLERYVKCCIPCILSERKKGKVEGKLTPIPKGDVPLSTYHVDHLGPMTTTGKAYKYLFVVVDAFSKFVWIYPTKTVKTSEVLDKLKLQQKTFGNPTRIISDRGAAFTSSEFREYCAAENIDHILITAGVPRGNGQVERMNRIIIPVLTKLSLDNPDRWYRYVDKVQRNINSTHQRSVGMSPFEVMFGIKLKQQEDFKIIELIEQETVNLYNEKRDRLREVAKENIIKIQEENRKSYNRNSKAATTYREGELVAIKRTQFGPGLKIKAKFLGPYKVTKTKRNDRYEVVRMGDGEGPSITSTSADFMKPYGGISSGNEEEGAGMAE